MLTIRTYLVVMVAAILLPVTVFSAFALHLLRNGEREAVLRGLQETARAAALIIDRDLGASLTTLKALATTPELETGDLENFHKLARPLNRGNLSWTVLIDESGRQLVNTRLPFGETLPGGDDRQSVQQVMATQKPLVSNLQADGVGNKHSAALFFPVPPQGDKRYVVAHVFSSEFFSDAVSQYKAPPGWIVAVMDRDGKFIARNHRAQELVGRFAIAAFTAAARTRDAGLIRHQTLEGVDVYDAFEHSDIAGWTIGVAAPVDSIETTAGHAILIASFGLLLAIASAVMMAAFLGRQLVQAIARAAEAAAALGRGAMPALPAPNTRELGQLHNALTEASSVLARSQASRLRAENERESLLQGEHQARVRAEAENIGKDHFLAMLGHELRNPLAAINGAIALNERYGHETAEAAEARAVIQRQTWHLTRLVDDLLDVRRIVGGKITLEMQPVDLGMKASLCLESMRAAGRTAGFRLRASTEPVEPVWVEADPTRLEQIINNLLVNAFKFTPLGGLVAVTVDGTPGEAVLTVKDSGIGITAELLPHVFEVFVQGAASLDRAQGGLGLGLALVSQLMSLHGGTVSAESAGTGRGSTFVIRLPRIAAPVAPPVLDSLPAASVQRRRWRIVLIEDNDDARHMMSQLLTLEGHQVFEAATATAGLILASQQKPDLAIVDIGLPEMTGYEVAQRLRGKLLTRNIGLIAMTGYGQKQDRENALAAGFDFHLVKSTGINRLLEVIEQCGHAALLRAAVAEKT